MKSDIYTKAVLTVIAACLLVLAARPMSDRGIISTAYAAAGGEPLDVRIVAIGTNFSGIPVWPASNQRWPIFYKTSIGGEAAFPVQFPIPLPVRVFNN